MPSALGVKMPMRDDAHVRHRRVGDQLLHIDLHERNQRGVDDGHDRKREHERREIGRRVRQHRQREAQEAVAAQLQQHARQQHRARGWRLDMRVRQPGMERPHRQLHRKRREEGEPQQICIAVEPVVAPAQMLGNVVVPACR